MMTKTWWFLEWEYILKGLVGALRHMPWQINIYTGGPALKDSTRNLRQHKILLKVLYLKPGLKDTSKGIWTDFLQTPVKYFLGGRYLLQKWKENISTAKCFFEMFDQNAAGDAAEQEIRNHLNPCLYFSSTNLLISLFIFLHIISGDAAVQEIRNHLHPQFVPLHITTKKDFQFPKKKIASHHNKTNFRFPKKKISSHHKERGFSISRRNKTKLG